MRPNDPRIFCSDRKDFAPGYIPKQFGPPQPSNPPVSLTPNQNADLTAAFTAASIPFRTALCSLDGVYIDPSAAESWGFRDPSTNPQKRYIGLSAALWSPGPSAMSFHDYETQRLRTALNWQGPSYDPANPDLSPETVLAALAHEYGHIFWYDTFKPNGHYPTDDLFGPEDPSSCKFYVSWKKPLTGPLPWRDFGSIDVRPDGTVINEHAVNINSDNVSLQMLLNDRIARNAPNLQNDLTKLYATNGRWASLLASFSIDEDFVETFQLVILQAANPPLLSMKLKINGSPVGDIPADDRGHNKKTELDAKEKCFPSFRVPG